jgi:uroporphyrin-III C-methyltransferase
MRAGRIFLVGAGPGDPELLTLKAAKLVRSADVVLYDDLVSGEILRLIRSRALSINVGKRCGKTSMPQQQINRLLLEYTLMGLQVVRLKGGDPFIFGRGGEELEALRLAGIEVEIVPGITAVLGAAASIGIPLTHRDVSSTLILVTGSSRHAGHVANWPDRLPSNATVVVYMPGHDLRPLEERLLACGVAPEVPCAIISGATAESEQVHITTVAGLPDAPQLLAPRLLVVGEVVRFADGRRLREHISGITASPQYSELISDVRENAE